MLCGHNILPCGGEVREDDEGFPGRQMDGGERGAAINESRADTCCIDPGHE